MATKSKPQEEIKCGLIMPISAMDDYTPEHWKDVKRILTEAIVSIGEPNFTIKLVSEDDDVGVIHKRIVQNIYSSDIIVCDVSGRNSNVMFELGMRLAFDKATVIVKDDVTEYSFDTGVIEHIPYPRTLRHQSIEEFKAKLAVKVAATYNASITDPNFSTFLKNFGPFQVAKLTETEVSPDNLVLESLSEIQREMAIMRRGGGSTTWSTGPTSPKSPMFVIRARIRQYMDRNDIASLAEVATEDLYSFLESDLPAIRYFESGAEFRHNVDSCINQMRVRGEFIRESGPPGELPSV
ncbi:MAG: RNA helicase [bacterium]